MQEEFFETLVNSSANNLVNYVNINTNSVTSLEKYYSKLSSLICF